MQTASFQPDANMLSTFRKFAAAAAVAAMAMALLVLAGWAFDVASIKQVLPGLSTMKPNTA